MNGKKEFSKALAETFLQKLLTVSQFYADAMIGSLDDTDGAASRALWHATERSAAEHNRRFTSAGGGGLYVLADETRRVKRVKSRTRAALRIVARQNAEIVRIDPSALSDKDRKSLDNVHARVSDISVRMKAAQRQAAKPKPAGL